MTMSHVYFITLFDVGLIAKHNNPYSLGYTVKSFFKSPCEVHTHDYGIEPNVFDTVQLELAEELDLIQQKNLVHYVSQQYSRADVTLEKSNDDTCLVKLVNGEIE